MTLVGEILERVILEGEYLAKEDDEQAEMTQEYITYSQYAELRRLVECISGEFHQKD